MTIALGAPFDGWVVALAEVPDAVFAQGMAGEGLAVDPASGVLHAPCDGEIAAIPKGSHAITLRAAIGVEILVHVGIDTVDLSGVGFEPLVKKGDHVKAGDPLVRFDLDLVARRAPSTVSPVVVVNAGFTVRLHGVNRRVRVGDVLMDISSSGPDRPSPKSLQDTEEIARTFRVPFEHGFHARPAAQLAAALRPFGSSVAIVARGDRADARSVVALMALGVQRGDAVEIRASGADAPQAIAALEAMFATPFVASAPQAEAKPLASRRSSERPNHVLATIACRGIAAGPALPWQRTEASIEENAADPAVEEAKLRDATASTSARLAADAARAHGELRAILGAHAELVRDPSLTRAAGEAIARGKSAGFAWRSATRALAAKLSGVADPRMRERAADLRDLEAQVLDSLAGASATAHREMPHDAIVIAEELLPSQVASLDRNRIAGICMARGGATSHAALIAAGMGLPTLVAAGADVLAVAEGAPLVLDAESGHLVLDPTEADLAAARALLGERRRIEESDRAAAHAPASTKDGVAVRVLANLGSPSEAAGAVAQGAEGCGLLRTEFLFLDRLEAPSEAEQSRVYEEIAAALQPRPLTIRTLDFGSDKPLAYLPLPREDNPALGIRGLRASLRDVRVLRGQLRAIVAKRLATPVRIMLPMVTELSELRTARALLEEECRTAGVAVPALGVMIETPSSALLADQLVREADFLSLGTNDLAQYTLAIDRGHAELSDRLDALHPAALRLIAMAARAANEARKPIGVCGALGADPDAIPILVGLGITDLSVVPAAVPRVKRTIRTLDAAACRGLAQAALGEPDAPAVRALVQRMRLP